MGKKSLRDPNAPKRNLPAFILYQNAMRDHFRQQNPAMTFGQLAKYASAMYANLHPQEKESWNQRAEADKARYLHELSTYVPPQGYDAKGDFMLGPASYIGGPYTAPFKTKPTKDSGAPKRNVSAYLLYQNAMRDQFKRENPDMTFGQLAKYTSHMYKNLTPEEKATWDERARQDKLRYDAEMAQYVPPPGHDARGNLLQDTRSIKRARRGPKDPAAPKRARGSFVFFTFEMRPVIMQENPNVEFVQMGRILGERWRALLPEQKKRYEDMAAGDKVRFQQEMEKYKATMTRVPPAYYPSATTSAYVQPPLPPTQYVPPAPSPATMQTYITSDPQAMQMPQVQSQAQPPGQGQVQQHVQLQQHLQVHQPQMQQHLQNQGQMQQQLQNQGQMQQQHQNQAQIQQQLQNQAQMQQQLQNQAQMQQQLQNQAQMQQQLQNQAQMQQQLQDEPQMQQQLQNEPQMQQQLHNQAQMQQQLQDEPQMQQQLQNEPQMQQQFLNEHRTQQQLHNQTQLQQQQHLAQQHAPQVKLEETLSDEHRTQQQLLNQTQLQQQQHLAQQHAPQMKLEETQFEHQQMKSDESHFQQQQDHVQECSAEAPQYQHKDQPQVKSEQQQFDEE